MEGRVIINSEKFEREKRKENMRRFWNNLFIFLEYLIREPYYEFKALFADISKNEVSLMYSAFFLFIFMYYHGIKGWFMYLLIFIIFSSWIYGIYKSGEWKKYYKDKYF